MTKEFEALLLTKTEATERAWKGSRRRTSWKATLPSGDAFHGQLQGWACDPGKAPVVRRWPMIPGIDFAGPSRPPHPEFKPGDEVVQMAGASARRTWAAITQYARVRGDSPVSPAARAVARRGHGD